MPFMEGIPDFEYPKNKLTPIVLDNLMDSAYSSKVSAAFARGSHHINIRLILIARNLFH
jgi:hypothetical protein